MNNKIIITALIIFLVLSFGYLSYNGQKQLAFGNWWSLYFTEPKGGNLNFAIENHQDNKNFHWEILAGKEIIKEGDIKIAKGATWKSDFQVAENNNKKITIKVTSGEEKKEIYKSFSK